MSLSIANGRLNSDLHPGFNGADDAANAWKRRSAALNTVAGAYSRKAGDDHSVAIWAMGGPLALTFISSVLNIAATYTGCLDVDSTLYSQMLGRGLCTSYTLSHGPVSAGILVLYVACYLIFGKKLPDQSLLIVSAVLVLWWTAAISATTFTSMAIPDSQYFSAWAAGIYSLYILHGESEQIRIAASNFAAMEVHTRATAYVAVASIVNFAAAITGCVQLECPDVLIYSLVVGPVSFITCAVLMKYNEVKLGRVGKLLAMFLVAWWAVAVGVQTLASPFSYGGNMFFSAWISLILSCTIAQLKVYPASQAAMTEI